MENLSRRSRRMRRTSLLVLLSFTSSLAAPLAHAETAALPTIPVNTQTMTNNAKSALSDLWYSWVKQGGSTSVKPDRGFAFNFFKSKGATVDQATLLTNNAQMSNQLGGAMPTSSSGLSGLMDKVKSIFTGKSAAAGTPGSPSTPGLPAPRPGLGDSIHTGLNKIGDVAHQAGQKVHGVAYDAAAGVTTALLTVKDRFDVRQFYSIPVTANSAVKITGGSSYDVRFTNKGWTNQQVSSKIGLVDAIKANEALGQANQLQTQFGPGAPAAGPVGNLISKFQGAVAKFKAKITGKPVGGGDTAELTKLKIQSNLLEHAQGLTQAQDAINIRIQKLTQDAARLGRPAPTEEIANLKRTFETIDTQKRQLVDKINDVQKSSASSVVSNGVKWALYSVGITASVNIIKQVLSGEKVDFKSAMSFVGQPSFWGGTVGGFIGSMVLSRVVGSMIPGGGIFMQVLPGFLGAALGYEAGSGLLGGPKADWVATIGQTVASAGGYALAYSLLGGAMAPGIALIGAGIAAGALFNFLYAKLRQDPTAMSGPDVAVPPADLGAPTPDPVAGGSSGMPNNNFPPAAIDAGQLDSTMKKMQGAYLEYINFLKEGKVTDARQAFDRYIAAKGEVDSARMAASAVAGR